MKYEVYQLKHDCKDYHDKAFTPYRVLGQLGLSVDILDYQKVWSDDAVNSNDDLSACEEAYCLLNGLHPEGFHGHSMSVSDIVRVNDSWYYCDMIGFKRITI